MTVPVVNRRRPDARRAKLRYTSTAKKKWTDAGPTTKPRQCGLNRVTRRLSPNGFALAPARARETRFYAASSAVVVTALAIRCSMHPNSARSATLRSSVPFVRVIRVVNVSTMCFENAPGSRIDMITRT